MSLLAREIARGRGRPGNEASQSEEEASNSEEEASNIDAKGSSFEFNDEDVLLAFDFENACSPVLRAAARSIIEDMQE